MSHMPSLINPSAPAAPTDFPFVDLRASPFNVIANDPSKGTQNTAGINAAIATYTGTKATLALPQGDIRIGRNGTNSAAVKFGTGITDLTFCGQGMHGSMLTVDDTSFGGDWHGLVLDGCERVQAFNFGIRQISDLGADGQQHHLIRAAVTGVGGVTRDILLHNIYFGSGGSLCDAFQIFGNTGVVTNVRLLHFLMKLDGIGPGSRSGVAVQRGYSRIEIGHGYIRGAKNSPLDMESTGAGTLEYPYLHHLVLDNSLGQTSSACSLSGINNGANVLHARIEDVTVLNGTVSISNTDDMHIKRMNVIATTPWAADTASPNVQVFQDNNDLVLEDLSLERSGTAAAGNLLDIQNTGTGVTIRGGLFVQATAAYPIYFDGSSNVKVCGGTRIKYSGSDPAKSGVYISAVSRDSSDVQIDGVDLLNTGSGGDLRAIVSLEARTGKAMNRLRVTNCDGNGTVATGVYLSFGSGSTFDPTPFVSGQRGWNTGPWKQVDQDDNVITTLYPCVSGNPGGAGAKYVGDATPASALTAPQGSMCVFRNGDSTALFFKATGTGNTGWTAITVP